MKSQAMACIADAMDWPSQRWKTLAAGSVLARHEGDLSSFVSK
jgi:hypothetical protein